MTEPTPEDVRAAILKAADAIALIPPMLTGPGSIPLIKADGNLLAAMHAVNLWEASLKQKEQVQK